MRILFKVIFFSFLLISLSQANEDIDLNKKLDELHIPDDKVLPLLSKDKLFIFNTRYSSLINRHELSLQGGHNFTSDGHLDVKQAALAYRYHLNSRWSFGLRYTRYSNALSDAGKTLFSKKQIVPDQDFSYDSQEIFASFNTIYGKLRWTADTVMYFDQYISLGGGQINLASGKANHGLLDIGFVFWIGGHGSFRVGIKNEFYSQNQLSGKRSMYNSVGHFEIGWLFGRGDRG